LLAYFGAVVNGAGVLEFDVIFPRTNETYAPSDRFPIVFALQNAELAKHIPISIQSLVRQGADFRSATGDSLRHLNPTSPPANPTLFQVNLTTEEPHELFGTVYWAGCDESSNPIAFSSNTTNFSVYFTIKKGGQEANLVTATEKCAARDGVAITVTDQTHEVPERPSWQGQPFGTCAVLVSSPTPTINPCRFKIDTAAAESMSAVIHAAMCRGLNRPADCPKEEENAVQQLVVVGVVSFAAALGAIGFLLA